MRNKKVLFITQGAVIAAIYVVLTYIVSLLRLTNGVIQVRLSEALTILPVFTPAAIPGLVVGCVISNILTGAVIWDVIFGCKANVDFVLDSCAIRPYFDAAISGDMVSRCKPDPEIYLTAAAALGVSPADCVIFEDARAGFEAARRAGAGRIVALTTTLPREELERGPLADRIIDSFADIADIGALLA